MLLSYRCRPNLGAHRSVINIVLLLIPSLAHSLEKGNIIWPAFKSDGMLVLQTHSVCIKLSEQDRTRTETSNTCSDIAAKMAGIYYTLSYTMQNGSYTNMLRHTIRNGMDTL